MKQFKHILYVTEQTVSQAWDIARAVILAENNQASLTVIDVMSAISDDYRTGTMKSRMKALEVLVEPYRSRVNITVDVLIGTLFLEAIRAVLRNSYDLVIKTAENPDYTKRMFGSADMHLLRKCPCPLLLLKPSESFLCTSVLAAVDFDPFMTTPLEQALNRDIIDIASSLAHANAVPLHLVHAWEAYAEYAMRVTSDISSEAIKDHVEKQYLLHHNKLRMLGDELRERIGATAYEQLSLSFHLPKGSAKKLVAALAAELSADLVVMGTVARTGISGLIIGNTAETILDQLECSVLAIKPHGFTTPVRLKD